MIEFHGVKIALINDSGKLLVYLRDNKPGLRFAGLWDFFGGGRENKETPFECVLRELREELSINLSADQIIFEKVFPAMHDSAQNAYFMVARLNEQNTQEIKFGSEGQEYAFVSVEDFIKIDDFVPFLKTRFNSYLESVK